MAAIENGGPAFPRPIGHNGLEHHEEHEANGEQVGMTLRDYFAAAALGGLVGDNDPVPAASFAYRFADAMIAARGRRAEDR